MNNDIKFWRLLSELNSYLLLISIESPEYEQKISEIKRELTKYIEEGLENSKKMAKLCQDSWYERNN